MKECIENNFSYSALVDDYDYIKYNANIMFPVKTRGRSFEVLSNRQYSSSTVSYSEMKSARRVYRCRRPIAGAPYLPFKIRQFRD